MKKIFVLALVLTCLISNAQKTDVKLQQQITELIKDFHGDIGIYVHDLKHHKTVSINADTVFPTASIVKISILAGIMNKIQHGELDYHQRLLYTDSLYYSEGDDILSNFKDSSTIELSKVMMLMLTISDNCASLWLQGLAGGGLTINALLDSLGYKNTRVNSRTPGRETYRSQYGWGQTTPREIATIMNDIVDKKIISTEASEKMLRLLGRQYWDEEALSQIPAGIFTADKNGAVDESRNEVLYVNCKNPYIFSIFTKNNKDTSWNADNEAWVLTRKLSALLWKHFN
ncbi:serine hydrolase [Parafilimonas terrae]|uniref:beta-lactamase n=1 Tax=Parafilimonas terrae TaxID=1465490 RepID=A0A1I5Z9H0_9BACT|nr:serine hydrolase [Parafilimonas terrae]SFQ53112.1 beta-lactamase class A [Parafilimonas terrae]